MALTACVTVLAAACSTTSGPKLAKSNDTSTSANSAKVDIAQRDATGPSDARKRAVIRLQLAVGYYQDAQFNTALDELKQALTIDPDFTDAHVVLALVYTELQAERSRREELPARAADRARQLGPRQQLRLVPVPARAREGVADLVRARAEESVVRAEGQAAAERRRLLQQAR